MTAERHIKKSWLTFVYYRCTKKNKTKVCSQRHYVSQGKLTAQLKELCEPLTIPDTWRDRFLTKLDSETKESRQVSEQQAQALRARLETITSKLNRLTEAYLAEALELSEYQQRKNTLVAERKTIDEQKSELAGGGSKWLELMREWILKANEPVAWQHQETPSRMREFLGSIGSNRRITGGQLHLDLPHPWDSLAALRVGAQRRRSDTKWWTRGESNPCPKGRASDVDERKGCFRFIRFRYQSNLTVPSALGLRSIQLMRASAEERRFTV